MTINFIYTIFNIFLILFALIVIISRNPIYSLFCLILVFVNTAFTLFLLKIEFFALILLIIYAGAISILFLFVILVLDIKNTEFDKNELIFESPISILFGLKFFFLLYLPFIKTFINLNTKNIILVDSDFILPLNNYFYTTHSINIIGNSLYTHFYLWFIICTLILLVAMLGALILTKQKKIINKIYILTIVWNHFELNHFQLKYHKYFQ